MIFLSGIFLASFGMLYYDNNFLPIANGAAGQALISTGTSHTNTPAWQNLPVSTGNSLVGTSGTALTITSLTGTGWIGINSAVLTLTKSAAQFPVPMAGNLSNLYVYVTGNLSTSAVTVTLNVNGTNSALKVTIPALTTGTFIDLTHLVSVTAGQFIQFEVSAATVGVITAVISMEFQG